MLISGGAYDPAASVEVRRQQKESHYAKGSSYPSSSSSRAVEPGAMPEPLSPNREEAARQEAELAAEMDEMSAGTITEVN